MRLIFTVACGLLIIATSACWAAGDGSSASMSEPERVAKVQQFISFLRQAQADGDARALVGALHPMVFDHWNEKECMSAVESIVIPDERLSISPEVIINAGSVTLDFGQGRIGRVDNVYRVGHGSPLRFVPIAFDDGAPRWFTNCDSTPGSLTMV